MGRDGGQAVSSDYAAPFEFTGGTIRQVAVDVSSEAYLDVEKELAAPFALRLNGTGSVVTVPAGLRSGRQPNRHRGLREAAKSSRGRVRRRLAPAVVSVLAFLALMLVGLRLAHPAATTPRGVPYQDLPAFRMWSIIGAAVMIVWLFVCAALWRIGTAWRYEDRALQRWHPSRALCRGAADPHVRHRA